MELFLRQLSSQFSGHHITEKCSIAAAVEKNLFPVFLALQQIGIAEYHEKNPKQEKRKQNSHERNVSFVLSKLFSVQIHLLGARNSHVQSLWVLNKSEQMSRVTLNVLGARTYSGQQNDVALLSLKLLHTSDFRCLELIILELLINVLHLKFVRRNDADFRRMSLALVQFDSQIVDLQNNIHKFL